MSVNLPGIGRLYLPDRLFSGIPGAYDKATDLPNGSVLRGDDFPFVVPGPMRLVAPVLKLHELKQATLSTGANRTDTAAQIQQLQQSPHALQRVQMCPTFFDNLVKYADQRQNKLRWIDNYGYELHDTPNTPAINTWSLPAQCHPVRLPTASEQAKGIIAIAGWFLAYVNRKSIIPEMNSEPAVQGEVLHGIIEPMNALLKTRYPPTPPINNNTRVNSKYPRWSRSCPALHMTPGNNSNAGYPDFLFLRSAVHGDIGAVAEVKTWWAYTNEDFSGIFEPHITANGVPTGSNHPASKLLRQLWGQLHFFSCSLGFCTNGQVIIFFVRVDPNTLVVSKKIDWDNPFVHQAMAGLSFAGMDLRGINRQGQPLPLIDRYLCPWGQRVTGQWAP